MTLIGEVPPGLAATAARIGDATTVLDEDQVTAFVQEQLAARPFDGRSVCVLVPDATRTWRQDHHVELIRTDLETINSSLPRGAIDIAVDNHWRSGHIVSSLDDSY